MNLAEYQQIVSENAEQAFTELGRFATSAKVGAESSFVSGEGAFNLPSLTVADAVLRSLHATPIRRERPLASAIARVQGDHRRAHAQDFVTQSMVQFAVVSGVGEQSIPAHMGPGLDHRLDELRRILARSAVRHGRRPQMRARVADDRQLGPTRPSRSAAVGSQRVMSRAMTNFQTGRVDRRLGSRSQEFQVAGPLQGRSWQSIEVPFFSNRPSA